MAMVAMKSVEPCADASPLLKDPPTLQEFGNREGYLFFRQLLPRPMVLHVRKLVLELCRNHGWLGDGRALMDGVANADVSILESNDPRWIALYREILCLRDFHALSMHPAILGMFEKFFGETAIAHSRNICRVMFPATAEYTTPPHQDHFYIGGTKDTWTAWIPLGDCPAELGGLAIIPGSHRDGFMAVHAGKGAGGRQVDVTEDREWRWSAMECGDALFFHSLTVHQARDNTTSDRLRLSVDYRYQPLSHPIRRDSMLPHMAGFGQDWDAIYTNWPGNDPLRYYWNKWPLNFVD